MAPGMGLLRSSARFQRQEEAAGVRPRPDAGIQKVAHRPSLQQLFGEPPPQASTLHGLPHPSEAEQSFWQEIEQQLTPKLPLQPRPGLLRFLVVGSDRPRTVELKIDGDTVTLNEVKSDRKSPLRPKSSTPWLKVRTCPRCLQVIGRRSAPRGRRRRKKKKKKKMKKKKQGTSDPGPAVLSQRKDKPTQEAPLNKQKMEGSRPRMAFGRRRFSGSLHWARLASFWRWTMNCLSSMRGS